MAISQAGLNVGARPEPMTQMQRQMAMRTTREVLHVSTNLRTPGDGGEISAGKHSLELVYRAAIEKLNEMLMPEFGPGALEAAVEAGTDFTPEGTAARIVSMATGFYDAFRERYQGEDEGVVQERFMATIRKGIEQGFEEARDILDGLGVLQGDIAANIDRTYALVQDGLAGFEQRFQRVEEVEAGG